MERPVRYGVVQTPAEFRQLHVKIPAITFHDPPSPEEGTATSNLGRSNVWLDAHGNGFLLMYNLHTVQNPGRCILLQSLDTGELIINKRLKRYAPVWTKDDYTKPPEKWEYAWREPVPNELRFSRLDDSRVAVRLPNEPYFPELYAYGFPYGYKEGKTPDVWSLYFKRYNDGSLSNLMEMYAEPEIGASVPEPFIWHVMEQLARAVIYLHTGLTRKELASKRKKHWMSKVKEGQWTPLVHRDICEENILLHFPEKGNARNRCSPGIVLEGFKRANLVGDDPSWWHSPPAYKKGRRGDESNIDESDTDEPNITPEPWEDIYLMGEVLRRLVAVYETGKMKTGNRLDFDVNQRCRMSSYLSENLDLDKGERPAHSDELINLLREWEIPELLDDPAKERQFSDHRIWQQIPSSEFLIKEVLPTAAKKMKKYRTMAIGRLTGEDKDGLMADVSWVMPDPAFEAFPYSTNKGSQEHALSVLKRELKYLYGPWIPVWYRYNRVVVTKVPTEAERFYAPSKHMMPPRRHEGEHMQLRGGGSDTDSLWGDESEAGSEASTNPAWDQEHFWGDKVMVDKWNGEEEEKRAEGKGGAEEQRGEEEEPRRGERDHEERYYESEEAEEQESQSEREPDPQYIARIRRFQSEEKAKQQPLRVWHPSREIKEAKPRGKVSKVAREAAEEYSKLVGDIKQRISDVFPAVDFDDCGCSNCIRQLNKFIVSEVKQCNIELKALHDKAIETIKAIPKFKRAMRLPEFEPLVEEALIEPPTNPFDTKAGVENWVHNPFDPDYEEDWEPGRYYPWQKWDYGPATAESEVTAPEPVAKTKKTTSRKRPAGPNPPEEEPRPKRTTRTGHPRAGAPKAAMDGPADPKPSVGATKQPAVATTPVKLKPTDLSLPALPRGQTTAQENRAKAASGSIPTPSKPLKEGPMLARPTQSKQDTITKEAPAKAPTGNIPAQFKACRDGVVAASKPSLPAQPKEAPATKGTPAKVTKSMLSFPGQSKAATVGTESSVQVLDVQMF